VRRQFAFGLVCVAALAGRAQSQKQPTTPGDVAKAFFEAAAAHKWRDAAGFVDLEAFETYRHQMVESARHPLKTPTITAAMLMKRDPDMPREVAEYQVRQFEKMRGDSSPWLSYEFADVKSLSDLAALSTIEAAARFIEAEDYSYKMREAARRDTVGCRKLAKPVVMPDVRTEPDRILGVIVRDSDAYVLHESSDMQLMARARDSSAAHQAQMTSKRVTEWYTMPPHVMQLRLIDGKWLILGAQGLLGEGGMVTVECMEDEGDRK
jgi:hypothetical protein